MQKLDSKAVWIFFFRFLLSNLIILIFLLVWSFSLLSSIGINISYYWLLAILLILAMLLLDWILAKWTYYFFGYQLTDNAFKKEQGIIWKKYVSIPYERIQNVDIHRGVIARILGLSDIHIQTAGSSAVAYGKRMAGVGAEGYLPGLNKDIAEQLREDLVNKAKSYRQGL